MDIALFFDLCNMTLVRAIFSGIRFKAIQYFINIKWCRILCLFLTGLGFCLVRLISISILNEISQQNFNLRYCLATCGFSAGVLCMPLLAATLIGPYGWRGGMLIIGAVMANIIPCSCAYVARPKQSASISED